MATEFRPKNIGTLAQIKDLEPSEAIQRLETDLMESASALRQIRSSYVNGDISGAKFDQIEHEFDARLREHRQILQNLRRAASSSSKS